TLFLRSDVGRYVEESDWWTGHVYPIETERGQDDVEDLFKPGKFVFETTKPATILLSAALDDVRDVNFDAEQQRRPQPARDAANKSLTIRRLLHAADDFLVDRKSPDGSPGVTIL